MMQRRSADADNQHPEFYRRPVLCSSDDVPNARLTAHAPAGASPQGVPVAVRGRSLVRGDRQWRCRVVTLLRTAADTGKVRPLMAHGCTAAPCAPSRLIAPSSHIRHPGVVSALAASTPTLLYRFPVLARRRRSNGSHDPVHSPCLRLCRRCPAPHLRQHAERREGRRVREALQYPARVQRLASARAGDGDVRDPGAFGACGRPRRC